MNDAARRVAREPDRPSDRLRALAARVRRLDGYRRDPEQLTVERHTIAAELSRIARELEGARSSGTGASCTRGSASSSPT